MSKSDFIANLERGRVAICRRCKWTLGFRGKMGFCDFGACAYVQLGPRQSKTYRVQLQATLALFDGDAWKVPGFDLNFEQRAVFYDLNDLYLKRLGANRL